MDIQKHEKLWLVASVAFIVLLIATVIYGTVGAGVSMVDDSGGTIAPDEIPDDDRFGEPRVEHVEGDEYEAYVVSRMFIFQPNTVEVPEGSTVTFYVTSADVIHGYQLVGTNVNTMVIPGQIAEITVEFDEPAEYGVVCNEYCGSGHHDMEGMVEVVPEDEWEGV